MENNQSSNRIDAITQFLTEHNTTIIAIIMAISALLGQHYQEQREEVYDDVEEMEDLAFEMEQLELEYGDKNSREYQAMMSALDSQFIHIEEDLFEESGSEENTAGQQPNAPQAPYENTPNATGNAAEQQMVDTPAQAYNDPNAVGNISDQPTGDPGNSNANNTNMAGNKATQKNVSSQLDKKLASANVKMNLADQKEAFSGYASTILQVSVLLSSIGMTNKARILTYLASFATLVGVVVEIIAAVI